jgi:FMN phosphatase YigB (HAD superfamily)
MENEHNRMTANPLRYPIILFDWGDTVMRDNPEKTAPMVEWDSVEVIDGITDVLAYLDSSGRQIALATSADISTESQIRAALARCGIETYFSRIYSFTNTNLRKGEAFYRHILSDLNIPASDALMIGDHFEKDVKVPNDMGISAVWFNPLIEDAVTHDVQYTVHSMTELRRFFEALDGTGSNTE